MTDEFINIEEHATREGTLYLVATPLGNRNDLSPRAKATLENVDYIAAEDTRRAARLMSSLGIGNRIISYYEHNKHIRHAQLLEDLKQGKSIALISDAGMPCISDPGEALVRLAVEQGIPVSVIPGPSALLSAVAASGLDTTRFVFEGFIPVKGKARREYLSDIAKEPRTIVFYEAPHRIRKTLADLEEIGLALRRVVVARELTKKYEEFLYFSIREAIAYYENMTPKGEFTLVLEGRSEFLHRTGASHDDIDDADLEKRLRDCFSEGLSVKDAVNAVSEATGTSRNLLYNLALKLI